MTEASAGDLAAKLRYIEAYFDSLLERIDFLKELRGTGHEREAMLLCCCYIDGLATYLYWPVRTSHRNFVRAVREYSPHDFLSGIHTVRLRDAIAHLRGGRAQAAKGVLDALVAASEHALLRWEQVETFIEGEVATDLNDWLHNHLWRGTLASIAYERLRGPSVHSLGSAGGISFGSATLDGGPVPDITFEILYATLEPLYTKARKRSIVSNKWFGHDLTPDQIV